MARLVIADDSDLLRRTIRKFLFDYPQFEIAGEARDYAETLALVTKANPDLLLLDLRMPGVESRAEVATLATACKCAIVAMTFSTGGEADTLAASSGAFRLIDKAHLYDELVPAMEAALRERGKTMIPEASPTPSPDLDAG
jgi:DNA-binding NarL/FixJ family response regulator